MNRATTYGIAAVTCCFLCTPASSETTVFFDNCQTATLLNSGVTSDTISSRGYLFTYTRDKLFTGGTGQPIGRSVRVPWPDGVEAQAVTTPPAGVTDHKARIILQRVDGAVFDLTSFTARLLASTAGAGGSIEIMPLVNGEDAFNDPVFFNATGNYWQTFAYDTTSNPQGSTAPLVGFDTYKIDLYVDFALIALNLNSAVPGDEACCLPDDSCAEMATDGCVTQGGTPQGVGTTCACTTCVVPAAIPTISQWSLVAMALLLLGAGGVLLRSRRSSSATLGGAVPK